MRSGVTRIKSRKVDVTLIGWTRGEIPPTPCYLARETDAIERTKQPDNWQRFWTESLLGASLFGEKKYAEAEPLLLEGYRGMVARKDLIAVPNWRYLDSAHGWIVQMYEAWGKPEKAAEWKQH